VETLRIALSRLRGLFCSEKIHSEIEEEMLFHIDMRTEENIRRGMSPEEARRSANLKFGQMSRIGELGYEVRGGGWLESFRQDVRYGLRMLWKNRVFASVTILALSLGIGANSAIYSVVDAVLLKPLPFADQEQLMVVWKRDTTANNPFVELSVSEFLDWQKQNGVFENVAAMPTTVYGYGYTVTGRGEPFQVESARVSASFFPTLGAQAALGRTFTEEEDRPGAMPTVVLSHRLWKNHFNGDPQVVGQQVTLRGVNYTIIGVMPQEFEFPKGADVWAPLTASMSQRAIENRGAVFLQAVGRLKPGVTVEQANAELNTITARLSHQYPETNAEGHQVVITPLAQHIFGNARPALHLLLAASLLLLLIACGNIANLLLARATARQREIAVRAALGASRSRLLRQFLTESLVLAFIGGTCGILLAFWLVNLLIYLAPADIPRIETVAINGTVAAFTCLITLLTVAVFGIVPALSTSKIDLNESLKETTTKVAGARQSRRLRSALVIGEVAITLMLLIGANLIGRSFLNLRQVPLGFDPQNVLTMQLSLQGQKYREASARQDFFKQLLERVESHPGVVAAGAVLIRPLEGTIGWDMPYATEGQTPDEANRNAVPNYQVITPRYFRAMSIPLIKGRDFSENDSEESQGVVIISETMARRIFAPGSDPIGQRIKLEPSDPESAWRTVVGVVSDVRYRELGDVRFDVYVPYRQSPVVFRYLIIRTSSDPQAFAPMVRLEVAALDPTQAVTDVKTMEQLVARSLSRPRFNMILLSFFALLAALLASIGIYGVMSYSVTQRTNEIGIRMALGAQRRDVLKLIVNHGLKLSLIGIGLGAVGAFLLTRVMTSLLFGVSATDPLTFILVGAFLLTVALLACYLPARRATKIDPLVALRHE
jgi:putative ABC transport system permease protein